ncbi:TPM domain-containing protein [Streptomyces sp. NPDC001634]|uniref:TPM domain-containing protein n=1 Tax=Streptomyces sp. NPDC001634 TaxID=3154390 RepID=UPI00331C61AF
MTPPHRRRRPRWAAAYPAVRRASVLGGAVLVAVALAVAAGAARNRTSTGDLVLPLVAVLAAVAATAYASVRRRRRVATRTTPGGGAPTVVSLDELDRRAGRLLVETDDCVRTSREELRSTAAQLGNEAVEVYAEAVEFAASELTAAFRARQRLDDGEGETRVLLEEIVARCGAAGRRLDAEAPGFDQIRALERTARDALERAEARFRELAGRMADTDGTLAALRERYPLTVYLPVAGHDEQAKDRLVFATTALNGSRQALDRGETGPAVVQLRAAEAAVDQATILVAGVARFSSDLTAATEQLPAALTDTESDLREAHEHLGAESARGDLQGRIAHGASVVAEVREEPVGVGATYGPVGALRRIEEVAAGLDRALHRVPDGSRALRRLQRVLVVARSTVRTASDYVTTHRGAVGHEARTRLSEAERRLRAAENTDAPPTPVPADALADAREADTLARQARQLAERDVRAYGTPYGDGLWTGGAVLGGILLDEHRRRGDGPGHPGDGGPASYGGPGTRGRRDEGELFRPTGPESPPPEGP